MNKYTKFGFVVCLLAIAVLFSQLASAVTTIDNPDNKPLRELDSKCPKVEVHPGYFVQQIATRTSQGIVCQFPGGSNKKKVTPVVPIVPVEQPVEPEPEPEPVCEWQYFVRCVKEKKFGHVWFCVDIEEFGRNVCDNENLSFSCSPYEEVNPFTRIRDCDWSETD